jgi:aerobic-type carbon monoxide dehydrogenase small subunit (CoxS/CutS family)
MRVSFRINGDPVAVDVEPRLHLADCLREVLSLTGTHLGCEHGACGSPTRCLRRAPFIMTNSRARALTNSG